MELSTWDLWLVWTVTLWWLCRGATCFWWTMPGLIVIWTKVPWKSVFALLRILGREKYTRPLQGAQNVSAALLSPKTLWMEQMLSLYSCRYGIRSGSYYQHSEYKAVIVGVRLWYKKLYCARWLGAKLGNWVRQSCSEAILWPIVLSSFSAEWEAYNETFKQRDTSEAS